MRRISELPFKDHPIANGLIFIAAYGLTLWAVLCLLGVMAHGFKWI